MEEELQKCAAAAAFEVPTSLNVVEYEQTLLLVSVAGATAHIGKTKPQHRGNRVIKCRRSKDSAGRVSAGGSGSQLTQSCTGPALHHQGLHVRRASDLLHPSQICFTLGDFIQEKAA